MNLILTGYSMNDTENNYYSLLSERTIEVEYIIADKDSMEAVPLAEKLIKKAAGCEKCSTYSPSDSECSILWSLTKHDYIVKFSAQINRVNIREAEKILHNQIIEANRILEEFNAVLYASAVYPLPGSENASMNIKNNDLLFSGSPDNFNNLIKNSVFNYHYMKLYLHFENEEEFFRLHTAVRLIMPLLPALTSGSPVLGDTEDSQDITLEIFKHKLSRTGKACRSIIPLPVRNRNEYEESINQCMKCDYVNNDSGMIDECRAVTADFEKGMLAVRIFDMQESPHVDFAVVRFITYILELIVNCRCSTEKQASISNEELLEIFDNITKDGLKGMVENEKYLKLLSIEDQTKMSAWGIWMLLAKKVKDYAGLKIPPVENILKTGSLSERIIKAAEQRSVKETFQELAECLEENIMMLV